MAGYNPYRQTETNILSGLTINPQTNNFFTNSIARLSKFGRNYGESALKNAKGIHANEDISILTDSSGYGYDLFSRKVHAQMQEKQTIAALSTEYLMKINILKEYASKIEIRDFVTKMANEIIVYSKDKKFCELEDLPQIYPLTLRNKTKQIFENIYTLSGFSDGSLAWDVCRDWLVEGYICREIIYDKKGKNIIGFQKLLPETVIPIVDPQSGLKIWIQYPGDQQNQRILLDAEIIYISYSGSSNYMETSYVEPLIRPYNELKSIERSRLLFNLINATMHKEFVIPTQGLSPALAEQEIATLIADYKDHVTFDDTTGLIYIDGSKDLPYSKEYWLPNPGDTRPEMSIIEPGGHDLNESSQLIWFKNALKAASKFPLSRLDNTIGGGNIYSVGGEITHDDYNFTQYIERLRTLFKDILLKPIILQILLDFPELENNNKMYNDLNINFYGHSEIVKAKELSNLQAKATIASELQNGLKREDDKPYFHWDYIAKEILELSDEQIALNAKYWKANDGQSTATGEGGSLEGGGGEGDLGGGEELGGEMGAQPGVQELGAQPGAEDLGAQTGAQPGAEEIPAE